MHFTNVPLAAVWRTDYRGEGRSLEGLIPLGISAPCWIRALGWVLSLQPHVHAHLVPRLAARPSLPAGLPAEASWCLWGPAWSTSLLQAKSTRGRAPCSGRVGGVCANVHHHSTQASLLGPVRDGQCVHAQRVMQGARGAAGLSVALVFRPWGTELALTPTTVPGVWVGIPVLLPQASIRTPWCVSLCWEEL